MSTRYTPTSARPSVDVDALGSAPSNPVRTKFSACVAVAGDVLLCNAAGAAFTVTLPPAMSAAGRSISVKKTDASPHAVTIDGAGSETIDGGLTLALSTPYAAVTLSSDGAAWSVLMSHRFPVVYSQAELDAKIAVAVSDASAAYVLAGAGVPITLAPTLLTGDGKSDRVATLTTAAAFLDGHKYRVGGTILVRAGAKRVAALAVTGHIIQFTSDGGGLWSRVAPAVVSVTTEPGWNTYFPSADELPGLSETADKLSLTTRPRLGQSVTVEFDGTVADLGPDA
jgi:hypothetical protein